MSADQIVPISDHYIQARDRNHQFNKDVEKVHTVSWSGDLVSGWEAMIHAFTSPAKGLEDVMNDMLNTRGLATAEGVNLDRIGQIVGAVRGGATDEIYVDFIIAQIGANNSDTTARDLMAIAAILVGDDLRDMAIKESFPAKATIDYLAEVQFSVTSANNALTVQVDLGGGSPLLPVVIPDGDFFPHELRDLISDLIEAAWVEPIGVDFTGLREFQFDIDSVPTLVDPAINWGTAGPLYGFTDGQTISSTVTGTPIAGPSVDASRLSDALTAAKAAGVDIDVEAVALGTYFGFSNDTQALGFGSRISPTITLGGGIYSTLLP